MEGDGEDVQHRRWESRLCSGTTPGVWPTAAHLKTLPPGGCLLGPPCSPALGHTLQLLVPGPGPGPGVALPGIALDAPLRAAASRALTHPHMTSWGRTDNTESWRRWLSHRVRPLNASPLWNPPQSPGGMSSPFSARTSCFLSASSEGKREEHVPLPAACAASFLPAAPRGPQTQHAPGRGSVNPSPP